MKRNTENGGDKEYLEYKELEEEFVSGSLHPMDLKAAVVDALN